MQLQDEYEVLRELGRGGFGVVYLVKHRKTGQEWAAKILLDGNDQHAFRLLAREVKQLWQYHDMPHVIRLVGDYLTAKPPFFLMPYAKGGTALRHVGHLSERQILTVMRQLVAQRWSRSTRQASTATSSRTTSCFWPTGPLRSATSVSRARPTSRRTSR